MASRNVVVSNTRIGGTRVGVGVGQHKDILCAGGKGSLSAGRRIQGCISSTFLQVFSLVGPLIDIVRGRNQDRPRRWVRGIHVRRYENAPACSSTLGPRDRDGEWETLLTLGSAGIGEVPRARDRLGEIP